MIPRYRLWFRIDFKRNIPATRDRRRIKMYAQLGAPYFDDHDGFEAVDLTLCQALRFAAHTLLDLRRRADRGEITKISVSVQRTY
jgi:hypothetical protein